MPVAVTEKLVLWPGHFSLAIGSTLTTGATSTVKVAAAEVAAGEQVPLTIQRYCLPSSPVTLEIFKVDVVAVL